MTRLTTIHLSIRRIIVAERTILSIHFPLRYSLFPFASHTTVSSGAVKAYDNSLS